jgi:hypothetical protein
LRRIKLELKDNHIQVLERLALVPVSELNKPVVGFTRYQISNGFNPGEQKISQSVILDYTAELEKYGLIKEVYREKFHTGKDKIFFDLTTYGLLKWFDYLLNHEEKLDIKKVELSITSSERLFPWIYHRWSELKSLFDEKTVRMVLLWSSDIDIDGVFEKYDIVSDKYDAALIARAPIYIENLKFFVHTYVYSADNPRASVNFIVDLDKELQYLFTFAFVHNLKNQVSNKEWLKKKESKIISWIKSEPVLYDSFTKYTEMIRVDLLKANQLCKQMESDFRVSSEKKAEISRKVSLLTQQMKKWKLKGKMK